MNSVSSNEFDSKSGSERPSPGRTADMVARVTEDLRLAIARGSIGPGERIRQDAIAEQLGVSRVPVREALKTLAAHGLVEHTMNSGFTVARLTDSSLRQIYRMRTLIEEEIMVDFPPIDSKLLGKLESIHHEMEKSTGSRQIGRLATLNRQFHFVVFEHSDMQVMLHLLTLLWDKSAPYQWTYLYDSDARTRVLSEHSQIIASLRAGDVDRYNALMREHRASSEAVLLVDHSHPDRNILSG